MKKILLINPNTEKAPYPVAPIGLGLLATVLSKQFDVRVFDATFIGVDGLRQEIKAFRPDFVGVSIRNIDDTTLGNAHFYIDDIKQNYIDTIRNTCEVPIVLGGSGYSLFPELLLNELQADYGVVSEAEVYAPALFAALAKGGSIDSIPGVFVRGGSSKPVTSARREKGSLDIPFSNTDRYVDFEPYRARGTYPILTKRGCHLKCVYCSYPFIEGRAYRLRDPKEIVDEIEQVAGRLGNVVFEFVDSTFNAPRGHGERICEEIIKRKLSLRFRSMGINPGHVNDRLLSLMRDAGFVQIVCSADSASPTMLKTMGKDFTRDKLETVASLIKKHDMPTMWSMIFGGPKESEETIEETFDFVSSYIFELDMVHLTEGIRIFPHTPIYDKAVAEGIISSDESILRPTFYVSSNLGRKRLVEIITQKSKQYANCIRAADSSPDPEMLQLAAALRRREGLDEPMFRTLLRVRKLQMNSNEK